MSRKKFEVPDKQLWDEVRATIEPVKKGRSVKTAVKIVTSRPLKTSDISSRQTPAKRPPSSPPPLASFDRRTAQKLGRGKSEPEARLDLHGTGLEDARYALLHFLASQRARGVRLTLVITGKGASPFAGHTLHGKSHFNSPEREGKIRRELPRWLDEAQFRIHVVGFQPAHPRHGGGGAFYVRLRKTGGVA